MEKEALTHFNEKLDDLLQLSVLLKLLASLVVQATTAQALVL
jgi:hypothetical protein